MLTRKMSLSAAGRGVVLAMIAALTLTMAEPALAAASSAAAAKGRAATLAYSDATDFSAARRRRHYHHGGNAAGLAFMGLAIGTIGAIAAQQRRNDYYDNGYGYGYAPGYYGGGPYYERRY
jgi:hypothetical protein